MFVPTPAGRPRRRPCLAGLRLPSLRGRARPLAKLAARFARLNAAARDGVGQRQRKAPGTAPHSAAHKGRRRRNRDHLPNDFMFQMENQDLAALRSQTVTSNTGRGGRRTAPNAFTEQGVAILSSVLNSPRVVVVNVEIMRTFVRVRELPATHGEVVRSKK